MSEISEDDIPPALIISGSGKRYVIKNKKKKRIKSKLTNRNLLEKLFGEWKKLRKTKKKTKVKKKQPETSTNINAPKAKKNTGTPVGRIKKVTIHERFKYDDDHRRRLRQEEEKKEPEKRPTTEPVIQNLQPYYPIMAKSQPMRDDKPNLIIQAPAKVVRMADEDEDEQPKRQNNQNSRRYNVQGNILEKTKFKKGQQTQKERMRDEVEMKMMEGFKSMIKIQENISMFLKTSCNVSDGRKIEYTLSECFLNLINTHLVNGMVFFIN